MNGLLVAAIGSALVITADAAVISFNATAGSSPSGMATTDIAGAPGASVSNWNNMYATSTNGVLTGSLAAGTIRNDSGTTVSLMALTISGTGGTNSNGSGSGTNAQRMFESEFDLFASTTFTLTNVPYALYDVYYYVQDADDGQIRGGDVTANTVRESITMFANPTAVGTASGNANNFAYLEANNQFTWNSTTTTRGTFLRIQDLTGSTLTMVVAPQNTGSPRLRTSGFQVVQVPEPTSLSLLGLCGTLALLRRRRA